MGYLSSYDRKGTFIINGAEKGSSLANWSNPWSLFLRRLMWQNILYGATIIPNRGAWFELKWTAPVFLYGPYR